MLKTRSYDINLLKHPYLKRITSTEDASISLWFFVGYNLLRVYVCCKEKPELFTTFEKSLLDLISLISKNYSSYIQNSIQLYKSIIDQLKVSIDKSASAIWLKACIDPNYQDSLKSIIDLGQYFAFCIVEHFNANYSEVIQSDPCKVLHYISLYFKIYIHVFTDINNSLMAENFGFETFVCYSYHSNTHFYVIHTENSNSFNDIKLIQFETYSDQVGIIENQQINPEPQIAEKIQELHNFPKLLSLVDSMIELIIQEGLFTKSVKESLELAIVENQTLENLAGVIKGSKIRETFCEEHKITINLKLSCGRNHCKECIFDKIFKEFSKDNYKILCPCNKQIPPKEINALKNSLEYLEFSSRNKNKQDLR